MNSTRGEHLFKSGLAEFTRNIRLGKFERSYDVAKRTVSILSTMIRDNHWPTARHLIDSLRLVCEYIDGLNLVETAAGNMTRRVMRIVRDECGVLENILEGIEQELMNELELSSKSIARQAIDYVQSDDIILTLGKSKVIETFLKHAAIGSKTGKRKFTVFVVELAPFYSGREMAKSLTKCGINTLIIPDSAVFANMCRVNKVIIGCHSMMANGGIKAPAGSHSIALAAKHYSVPLIVCCPMYKLTPSYLVSHDSVAFKQFSNLHAAYPEPYISTSLKNNNQLSIQTSPTSQPTNDNSSSSNVIESLHSIFDYVPPELITLFVSNIGGNSPSYVYQLLNELYCKSDYLD